MNHPDDLLTLDPSTLHHVTGGVAIASGGGSSDVNQNLLTAMQSIKSSIVDVAKARQQPDNSMSMMLPMMMMMKQRQG